MRALAILLFSSGFAASAEPKADDKTTTVIAEGIGKDEKEARKAAFRDAVSKVVGTLVDAETRVKNDEIISEKILEYSGGFIKSYDTLKTEKTNDGLIRIQIKAVVERSQVVGKLSDAKITSKEIKGTDLLAEKLTKEEARKNATEMLAKLFEDLPKMMRADVVEKPRFNKNGDAVLVDIAVSVDQKAYGEFVKRAAPILEKISIAKSNQLLTAVPFPTKPDVMLYAGDVFKKSLEGETPKGWPVWMVTFTDDKYQKSRWNMYWVDAESTNSLAPLRGKTIIRISLTGADDALVTEAEVLLNKLDITCSNGSWCHYKPWQKSKSPIKLHELNTLMISPFFVEMGGYHFQAVRPGVRPGAAAIKTPITVHNAVLVKVPYQFVLKLTDKELEKVKNIKASVVLSP